MSWLLPVEGKPTGSGRWSSWWWRSSAKGRNKSYEELLSRKVPRHLDPNLHIDAIINDIN